MIYDVYTVMICDRLDIWWYTDMIYDVYMMYVDNNLLGCFTICKQRSKTFYCSFSLKFGHFCIFLSLKKCINIYWTHKFTLLHLTENFNLLNSRQKQKITLAVGFSCHHKWTLFAVSCHVLSIRCWTSRKVLFPALVQILLWGIIGSCSLYPSLCCAG